MVLQKKRESSESIKMPKKVIKASNKLYKHLHLLHTVMIRNYKEESRVHLFYGSGFWKNTKELETCQILFTFKKQKKGGGQCS